MVEEIGKVKLDYSVYAGKDLYSDGDVEDELLDIVKNKTPAEYAKVIEQRKSWPILYHLSPLRENIIDWLPKEAMIPKEAINVQKNMNSRPDAKPALDMNTSIMNDASDMGTAADAASALSADSTADRNSFTGTDAAVNSETEEVNSVGSRGSVSCAGAVDAAETKAGVKVLEVGSGCGAITGALVRKAGSVTCVELSKKRSLINAYRHKDYDNLTIHVGNFRDVEPNLPRDFDLICLIGVYEYAQSYMGGDTPYEDFLKILLSHLAPEGRLVIAIENQYGLKYFAGCKEDHLGTYFSGIENYEAGKGARTFSRAGLERIFQSCGVDEWHFYYPYPDYKFMTTLYSDEFMPKKGELSNNLRNFDRDRMLLFDEKAAFDGILKDGLFPVFANSYLVVLGKEFETKYVKYSNDRAPEYAIRTEISSRIWHRRQLVSVRKCPQTPEAVDHIKGMAAAYESLTEKYRGGSLEINRCVLADEGGLTCAEFEFVPGIPLSELMDACLERNDLEGFYGYFRQYLERVGYHSEYPAADFDPIFSNILVEQGDVSTEGEDGASGDKWTLIDYEWTFGRAIDIKELAFRAVYCYLLEDAKRSKLDLERILKELSITEETAEYYREQEREFQRFVTGERLAMPQIRDVIGYRAMVPQKWIDRYQDSELVNRVQIYEDKGKGFSEEESYFVEEAYQGDNFIDLKLQVGSDVNMLRIDPSLYPCVVKLKEMTYNGERMLLDKKKMLTANGRIIKPSKENAGAYYPTLVFATEDPNIHIALGELAHLPRNSLRVRMEIVRLPLSMAQDLAEVRGMRWFGN